jgi:hypothetical protein
MLCVQTKWRGYNDRIKVFPIKKRSVVVMSGYLIPAYLIELPKSQRVHISGCGNPDSRNTQEAPHELLPAAASSDQAQSQRRIHGRACNLPLRS